MIFDDLVYIDATGYHFPDYPTVLTRLQGEYRGIYGADVYLEADSQDGQWLAIQAKALYDAFALGAVIYSSYSPATSQSDALSRDVKINGIERREATHSTAELVIVGQTGTLIQNGVAQDILGQKWNLPANTLIPDSGTITVTATADAEGAVPASANTINKIYTPLRGWQTVNNPAPATLGVAVEDDAELRERQTFSTALPSLSVFDGTIGAVKAVSGVIDVRGYENDSGSTDGNGIPAHSISIVAEGGDDDDIANAIAVKKTPGTGTYGTTSVVTTDMYGVPNTINFYRPTLVPITVVVNITTLTGFSTGTSDLIKAAIAAYITAIDIGNDVLFTKLYVPANLPGTPEGATFDIDSILIARSGSPAAANVAIAFNELSTCDVSLITVNT